MFIYGQDIPLDDVRSEETADSGSGRTVEPAEFAFVYGKDMDPEQAGE
ncbi:hypothetical protein GE107_15885 [Cohnella sp. CFH 77786]|nr:hypothetical protein [Cohnella sp. CFH 77786]MBW5447539.1 hypothetical protein [Cohnella sp. CFH 77786]